MLTSLLVGLASVASFAQTAVHLQVEAPQVAATAVVQVVETAVEAVSVPTVEASSVTGSGEIVVTAEEKAAVKAGMFQGVTNLISLLMVFSDIIIIVGALFMGFGFLKKLIMRR